MKPACLGIILTACCLAQSPLAVEKGRVSGVVTNAAGEALRHVTLQLKFLQAPGSAMDGPVSDSATETDSQGNFTFDEVAPGRYLVIAERTGYLNAMYDNGRGEVLTVKPNEETDGVVIKMTPQSIIAGRVVDDDNEPVPGATVDVSSYSASTVQPGRAALPGGRGTTNADGAFAIGSLRPGRYVVSVAAPPRAGPVVKSRLRNQQDAYVVSYYPDAIDVAGATPVELTAGAQARGLEIRLHKVAVFRVSGKVMNAVTGEPGSADIVNLIRQGSGPPGLRAQSTGVRTGEFSFDEVLPGTYVLETKSTGEIENNPPFVGREIISVGNGDLDRVALEMKPGVEVRGEVIVEGTPVSSWPKITLSPTEGLNNPDFAMIDVDGGFALTGLEPALYRISIVSLPSPTFVKLIRFNGHDIADSLIDLASTPTASLEIVISDRASSISGLVSDATGPVGPAVTVMAQPRRTQSPPRITRTDENGRFSLAALPPGEYLVMAMGTLFGLGQLGPSEFFEKFGKAVSVGESGSVSTDLRLITMDDLRAADVR